MDKFLITDEDIELFKINYSNSKIKIFRKMGEQLSGDRVILKLNIKKNYIN